MKTSRAILGVLAGLAAGAALGVLLAPDKGERTQRKIRRKAEDLLDEMEDTLGDRFEHMRNKFTRGKQCDCDTGACERKTEATVNR
jgi:gas vesicle protein